MVRRSKSVDEKVKKSSSSRCAKVAERDLRAARPLDRLEEQVRQLSEALDQNSRELQEALEFQKATNDVLGIISHSLGQVQPVFDTIAESAARLCRAQLCHVFRFDGELVHFAAAHGLKPDALGALQRVYPMVPGGGSAAARAILSGNIVLIPDAQTDADYAHKDLAQVENFRSVVAVPIVKDDTPIGAIAIARSEAGNFPEQQITLLRTFADQAVIAIENAQLFTEIQNKNRQVEEQAAPLAEWNQTLEKRVSEQVDEIGRMSKLTRFLSPKISNLIMSGEVDDPLKTRRSEITAVYVDLRGFTSFTETADPEEVMSVLREYHEELGRAITAYDATIEHYAGDGAMILFNAPLPAQELELHAVKMCLQMRDSIGALTEGWRKRGFDLGCGSGIAGGYVTLGMIGFEERMDYRAVGTVCNLAARLCNEAAHGQILIPSRILLKIEEVAEVEPLGDLKLKGIRRPVAAYNVIGLRGGSN